MRKRGRWLPVWHFVFVIYLALLVRLIAMAEVGPAAYANKMALLENGTLIERIAAHVMYMDPVSREIAVNIRAGMRKIGIN